MTQNTFEGKKSCVIAIIFEEYKNASLYFKIKKRQSHSHIKTFLVIMTQTLMLFFCLLQIVYASAIWESNAKTVAGGNGEGNALNQLNSSYGVFVDSDGALFIADYYNHRVVKWSQGASTGTILAGGECGQIDQGQLCHPSAITFDKEGTMFVTVEDNTFGTGNGSVISWKKGAESGETIIFTNSSFYGIALDAEEKYLYVGHHRQHRVLKYTKNGTSEGVVAGGYGRGPALNQLDYRKCVKLCHI
jgi:DNA-binding beta-propeller fold protein YncE